MESFRGRRSAGNWLGKALPCVCVVIFCLLLKPTTVAAPSMPAIVQERSSSLTDEVAALQEIANATKSSAELQSNNWSWFKVQLAGYAGSFPFAILTGVTVLYLADRGRKKWSFWKDLMPIALEDCTRQVLAALGALGLQIATAVERMATTTTLYANEVANLRAEVATTTTLYANEVANLRAEVANLQARKDETNRQGDEESLRFSERYRKDNPVYYIMAPVETEPVQKGRKQSLTGGCLPAAYVSRREAGYLSA